MGLAPKPVVRMNFHEYPYMFLMFQRIVTIVLEICIFSRMFMNGLEMFMHSHECLWILLVFLWFFMIVLALEFSWLFLKCFVFS